jgi:hypothetical protein
MKGIIVACPLLHWDYGCTGQHPSVGGSELESKPIGVRARVFVTRMSYHSINTPRLAIYLQNFPYRACHRTTYELEIWFLILCCIHFPKANVGSGGNTLPSIVLTESHCSIFITINYATLGTDL